MELDNLILNASNHKST